MEEGGKGGAEQAETLLALAACDWARRYVKFRELTESAKFLLLENSLGPVDADRQPQPIRRQRSLDLSSAPLRPRSISQTSMSSIEDQRGGHAPYPPPQRQLSHDLGRPRSISLRRQPSLNVDVRDVASVAPRRRSSSESSLNEGGESGPGARRLPLSVKEAAALAVSARDGTHAYEAEAEAAAAAAAAPAAPAAAGGTGGLELMGGVDSIV